MQTANYKKHKQNVIRRVILSFYHRCSSDKRDRCVHTGGVSKWSSTFFFIRLFFWKDYKKIIWQLKNYSWQKLLVKSNETREANYWLINYKVVKPYRVNSELLMSSDFSWEIKFTMKKWKEHIIWPLNKGDGPMGPFFVLYNTKNPIHIYSGVRFTLTGHMFIHFCFVVKTFWLR